MGSSQTDDSTDADSNRYSLPLEYNDNRSAMKIGVIRRCHDHTRRRSSSAISIDYNRSPRPSLTTRRASTAVTDGVFALDDLNGCFGSQLSHQRRSDEKLHSRPSLTNASLKQPGDDVTPELCNSKLFSVVFLMLFVILLTFAFAMIVRYVLR